MRKREFKEIKTEAPKSRIWGRTRDYQKSRDNLALVLKKWDEKNERYARMNYLKEKAFSKESFSKQDYDFILWLSAEELQNFVSAIRGGVSDYRDKILSMSEVHEDDPYEEDVDALFAWNKILRFISQTRNGVYSEPMRAVRYHTDVEISEKGLQRWTDDMKKIYPNREVMISANEADAQQKREKLKQDRKNTLTDQNRQNIFESIYWDKESVIKDLRENFVTTKDTIKKINIWKNIENIEWKEIHFELPAVWDFKWFKFDFFVSNDTTNAEIFRNNSKLEKQLYSIKEIWDLLDAIRSYMIECGVQLDGHWYVDYEEDFKYRKTRDCRNEVWSCLNAILGFKHAYWLRDSIMLWQENWRTIRIKPHVVLRCHKAGSYFDYSKDPLTLDDIGDIIINRLDWWMLWSWTGVDDASLLTKLS